MVETKEKKIDGLDVMVTQFPAVFAFKMKLKLIRLFGPSILKVISGLDTSKGDKLSESDIDLEKLGGGLQDIFGIMDEEDLMNLIFDLMQSTRVGGQEVNQESFNSIFPGKLMSVFKIVGFVLEVNYGNFFGKGGIGTAILSMK